MQCPYSYEPLTGTRKLCKLAHPNNYNNSCFHDWNADISDYGNDARQCGAYTMYVARNAKHPFTTVEETILNAAESFTLLVTSWLTGLSD